MGARGRRGLLAGLESLAASTNNISERNRRRLADQLAQEESRRRDEESARAERSLAAALAQQALDRKVREDLALSIQDLPGATEERQLSHPLIRTSTRRVPLGNSVVMEPTATTRSLQAAIRADRSPNLSEITTMLKPPRPEPIPRSMSDWEAFQSDPETYRKFKEASHFADSGGGSDPLAAFKAWATMTPEEQAKFKEFKNVGDNPPAAAVDKAEQARAAADELARQLIQEDPDLSSLSPDAQDAIIEKFRETKQYGDMVRAATAGGSTSFRYGLSDKLQGPNVEALREIGGAPKKKRGLGALIDRIY